MRILAFLLLFPMLGYGALGRVSVELLVSSQANGNRVRDKLATFLSGKQMVDCSPSEPTILPKVQANELGGFSVIFDGCFQLRTDAETLKSQVQTEWTSGGDRTRIQAGSRVEFHMCSHGDREVISAKDARAERTEVRK